MMRAMTAILGLSLGLTALGACKIVPNPEPGSENAASQTDEDRMAAKAGEIYTAHLVPYVSQKAIDLPMLTAALQGGYEAAGKAHGVRPQAEGSPWNFLVKGQGTVVEANRESRAATMTLDSNGDGQADVTIQLGPVIKGTALRDAADFIVFTDYRDQIEFAKLARALNDRAHQAIQLPEGDLTGKTFRFEGATTLRGATDPILIVPTVLDVLP
jgi:predicted lipoprotein